MYTSVNNSIPAITANSSARCQRNINNDHNCNNVNTYPTKFRTLAYSFQKQYAAANINSIAISSTQLPNHIITSPDTPQTADTSIKSICHKLSAIKAPGSDTGLVTSFRFKLVRAIMLTDSISTSASIPAPNSQLFMTAAFETFFYPVPASERNQQIKNTSPRQNIGTDTASQ